MHDILAELGVAPTGSTTITLISRKDRHALYRVGWICPPRERRLASGAETTGFALADRLARELTSEHRTAIMCIKQALHQQGRLCDGISTRVYLAVVDAGVRSFEEFERLT